MLNIFKIVSVLTFLKIVLLIVYINSKNFANLNFGLLFTVLILDGCPYIISCVGICKL